MELLKSIPALLKRKEDFVLATILDRSGSAPRAVGTRMIVRSDGSIMGTVGGGIFEASVQQLAKQVFIDKGSVVRNFVLTSEDAESIGMICGGRLQVMVQFVDSSDPLNSDLFGAAADLLKSRRMARLVTRVPQDDVCAEPPRQGIVMNDGAIVGYPFPKEMMDLAGAIDATSPEFISYQQDRFLVEPLCGQGVVYIFGAGHISQKLALLTKMVGFHTVVLDDRKEFASRKLFPSADEIIVLDSFENALNGLEIGENSFLVLVTRGHIHDKTVLRHALATNARYIGMIGSLRKRDAIYRELGAEGIDGSQFERVHSPIGVGIGAETPEEIAVSIVAELIDARA